MEDLIFTTSITFIISGLIYLIYIRPYYFYKKCINQNFINELKSQLNLLQTDDKRLESIESKYFTEIVFIKPSNQLFSKITIRLILNYKPKVDFKSQYKKTKELNKLNHYHWVANMISTDIDFLTKRPSIKIIKEKIQEMQDIINKERFEGIKKEESNLYGEYWDAEMNK